MQFKNGTRVLILILAAMMVALGPLKAQQFQMPQQQQAVKDYSEKEIDDFVGTVAKVLPVQQEGEMKMVEKIEESGMELEAFNQVATLLQSGQADGISESDMAKFQEVSGSLNEVQQEVQQAVVEIIEDEVGLEVYQKMLTAYQSDESLRQKVDTKLQAMLQ